MSSQTENMEAQVTSDPDRDTEALEIVKMIAAARAEQNIILAEQGPEVWDRLRDRLMDRSDFIPEAEFDPVDPVQERQREIQRDLLADVGDRYSECRLANFVATTPLQQRVVASLTAYCKSITIRHAKREGLVLYGPVGTGKDHLAFAVARAAVLAGLSVKWLNGQDWYGQVRDAMDGDTSEATLIRRIASRDFAVISDPLPPIGNLTQHQATMLYRAVEARYAAGKPTIVTVNVADDNEADMRLGAPTWDRLCHGAGKVKCEWASYRKPAWEIA